MMAIIVRANPSYFGIAGKISFALLLLLFEAQQYSMCLRISVRSQTPDTWVGGSCKVEFPL